MTKSTKATSKFTLFTSAADISVGIKSMITRGKNYEKIVHKVLVSCLAHADKHGDITLANKAIEGLSAGMRTNAARDWFVAHGKFAYNEETKQLDFAKGKTTKLQEAIDTPFWKFKPEAPYKPLNLLEEIQKLLKKANARLEDTDNAEKNVIDLELVKALESLIPASKAA